jgi:protein tyrosine/serine phosphatase
MRGMKSHQQYVGTIFLSVGIAVAGMVLVWSPITGGEQEAAPATAAAARPSHWAQPLKKEGLPNLHKVSDTLYRGAQPTAPGFAQLKEMGIKTVVNLRSFHSDQSLLGDTKLGYESITMKAWRADEAEVVHFLKIVTNPEQQPVFVHCQHGSDRTGTMCAIYRIVVQGWKKEDALEEMRKGGYGFFEGWQNLVDFINELDVAAVRKQAGLKE